MILLAGGTGMLGKQVLPLLTGQRLKLRLLTSDPGRAPELESDLVEVVSGDVRDPDSLTPALAGVQTVISAMTGYDGRRGATPRSVDAEGNRNLIKAAEAAKVEHFVLVSMHGAASDHPTEIAQMKFVAEHELRKSRLTWTIIRPTAYMETWAMVIAEPLLKKGKALVFGRGQNPINFVSTRDVARFVELAVTDSAMHGATVDVGGPENLTLNQFVDTFASVTGGGEGRTRIPRPMMQLLRVLMRPTNPTRARMISDALAMDTSDFTFDSSARGRSFPTIPLTSLAEAVRLAYVDRSC